MNCAKYIFTQNANWQLTNKQVEHGIRPREFANGITSNHNDESLSKEQLHVTMREKICAV